MVLFAEKIPFMTIWATVELSRMFATAPIQSLFRTCHWGLRNRLRMVALLGHKGINACRNQKK